MNNETFRYSYSAKKNKEIQEIRKKYLPCEENKLDELRRLDNAVQTSGMIESLSAGIGGAVILGLGVYLALQLTGNGVFLMALGVLLAVAGTAGMFVAYPVYRRVYGKTKEKYAPRILELTSDISEEKIRF